LQALDLLSQVTQFVVPGVGARLARLQRLQGAAAGLVQPGATNTKGAPNLGQRHAGWALDRGGHHLQPPRGPHHVERNRLPRKDGLGYDDRHMASLFLLIATDSSDNQGGEAT